MENIIENNFNRTKYSEIINNKETITAAIDIPICVNPEIAYEGTTTWFILTNNTIFLIVDTPHEPKLLKKIDILELKDVSIDKNPTGFVSLKFTLNFIIEKIEGYMLGKEKLLKVVMNNLREMLPNSHEIQDNNLEKETPHVPNVNIKGKYLRVGFAFSGFVMILLVLTIYFQAPSPFARGDYSGLWKKNKNIKKKIIKREINVSDKPTPKKTKSFPRKIVKKK